MNELPQCSGPEARRSAGSLPPRWDTGQPPGLDRIRQREAMMAPRRYVRTYPVSAACSCHFGGAPFVGEGLLSNLSLKGCSVTRDREALCGSEVRVSMLLNNEPAALPVELGTIKWVKGNQFGGVPARTGGRTATPQSRVAAGIDRLVGETTSTACHGDQPPRPNFPGEISRSLFCVPLDTSSASPQTARCRISWTIRPKSGSPSHDSCTL